MDYRRGTSYIEDMHSFDENADDLRLVSGMVDAPEDVIQAKTLELAEINREMIELDIVTELIAFDEEGQMLNRDKATELAKRAADCIKDAARYLSSMELQRKAIHPRSPAMLEAFKAVYDTISCRVQVQGNRLSRKLGTVGITDHYSHRYRDTELL